MFKTLDPGDKRITPFKVNKTFTVTNADSGSGVFSFRAISGSINNFDTSTALVKTYQDVSNNVSSSFYSLPSWHLINNMYYKQKSGTDRREFTDINPYQNFGANDGRQYRFLHTSASVISIPQKLYGERIKPGSVTITDDSGDTSLSIKDDGDGNLYDFNYSSSFVKFKSGSAANGKFDYNEITDSTGSVVGNIFYEHGVLVMTDTGSKYIDVGQKEGTDGFSIEYKAQATITEHEYTCIIGENEFNGTMNISATKQRSGSISVTGDEAWKLFPPGHATATSGSYGNSYTAATEFENFVTHSEFRPYVTKVGLYNDFNQLIAIGQLSAPIKNEKDISLGIVVRFDA